jgi:hypothetical protein
MSPWHGAQLSTGQLYHISGSVLSPSTSDNERAHKSWRCAPKVFERLRDIEHDDNDLNDDVRVKDTEKYREYSSCEVFTVMQNEVAVF